MVTLYSKSFVFQHSFTINNLVRSSITERLDQYNYIRKCNLSCHYAPHAQYVKKYTTNSGFRHHALKMFILEEAEHGV